MLNPYSFDVLSAPSIILIQDFMYMWPRPSTDVNSLLIPVGGSWFTPAENVQGVFYSGMIFTHPGRDFVVIAQDKLSFLPSTLPFLGRESAHTLYIFSFMCPHYPCPLKWGRPPWNFWFLITEISCNIGSSCSWVTSTDSFGKPDWVLSSVSGLVSQERQQQLLENSSSREDVEGRQSYSSPRMDIHFLPALIPAVDGSNRSHQAEALGTCHWQYWHMLVLVHHS